MTYKDQASYDSTPPCKVQRVRLVRVCVQHTLDYVQTHLIVLKHFGVCGNIFVGVSKKGGGYSDRVQRQKTCFGVFIKQIRLCANTFACRETFFCAWKHILFVFVYVFVFRGDGYSDTVQWKTLYTLCEFISKHALKRSDSSCEYTHT